MANIIIRNATAFTTEGGEAALLLAYDIPGLHKSPAGRNDHEQTIPITAVWQRMAVYDLDKAEAIELIVLERVAPDAMPGWPHSAEQRKAAKGRHAIGLRDVPDLVPDPTEDDLLRYKQPTS